MHYILSCYDMLCFLHTLIVCHVLRKGQMVAKNIFLLGILFKNREQQLFLSRYYLVTFR
jgi:hypothetical protein